MPSSTDPPLAAAAAAALRNACLVTRLGLAVALPGAPLVDAAGGAALLALLNCCRLLVARGGGGQPAARAAKAPQLAGLEDRARRATSLSMLELP